MNLTVEVHLIGHVILTEVRTARSAGYSDHTLVMDTVAITVFVLVVLQASAQDQRAVPITVFYETLCPDSRNFIVRDLTKAHKKFGPALDVDFIPFGKAQSTLNGDISCQHGPSECLGNMIDNCVLNNLPKGQPQVDYVSCRMDAFAPDDSKVQQCAENAGLSWADILSCSNSSTGRSLMLSAEEKTRQLTDGPKFVPTVTFNYTFNNQHQDEVERGGFMSVLCNNFQLC